jgi:hypothetical protein
LERILDFDIQLLAAVIEKKVMEILGRPDPRLILSKGKGPCGSCEGSVSFAESDGFTLRLVKYGDRWSLFDVNSESYVRLQELISSAEGEILDAVYDIDSGLTPWVAQSTIDQSGYERPGGYHSPEYHVRVAYDWHELRSRMREGCLGDSPWYHTHIFASSIAAARGNKAKAKFSHTRIEVYYNSVSKVIVLRLDGETVAEGTRVDPLLYQCVWIFPADLKAVRAGHIIRWIHVDRLAGGGEWLSLARNQLFDGNWGVATYRPQALVVNRDACPSDIPVWYDSTYRRMPDNLSDLPTTHGYVMSGVPLRVSIVEDHGCARDPFRLLSAEGRTGLDKAVAEHVASFVELPELVADENAEVSSEASEGAKGPRKKKVARRRTRKEKRK